MIDQDEKLRPVQTRDPPDARLGDHRKAMLHILADYEADRSRLARQTERLDSSRRALIHILKDSHESNLKLGRSRRAMIHIMGDLRETTAELERREQELRVKQAQLVQAGKLATLGELTTGIAHELNNPLNNIGLFVGNALDEIAAGHVDDARVAGQLREAMEQVERAGEIISHLRTFGRAAAVQFERVDVNEVLERALSFMHEQLRLCNVTLALDLDGADTFVEGNAIQLEQIVINLLTNARDALREQDGARSIRLTTRRLEEAVRIVVADNGSGIPTELEERIFDPFFTTKEVGGGTGLGLSITYGIVTDHGGTISVGSAPGGGAAFTIELPLWSGDRPAPVLA
jgi:C4-dicarboxylate-specific signal transduction histidine kinase